MSCRPTVVRLFRGTPLSVVLALAVVGATFPDMTCGAEELSPSKVVTAHQARKHVGERVTVTFKVQHAKFATMPDRVYLDSEQDYRDPKNLGILIEADALPAFTKAGIKQPQAHYDGKTIRITGTPFLHDDTVFIKVERPDQIEIIVLPKSKLVKP